MELKEGYKKTEVGIIPEDWEVTELGSISKVSSGGTPNRGIPSYWNGTIPWITTTLIDFNTINKANEFITEEGLNNSAAKIFNRGDLLMAMYGQGKTRGKVSILGINAATNQACAAISLNKDVVKEYVFCNLSGRYDEIRNLSNTGNQENLSGDLIKKIKIPLPPTLAEQKVIARVLSDTDALIQTLEKKIAKKKLIKKGVMQKLLTPKEGWSKKPLSEFVKLSSGESPSKFIFKESGNPYFKVEQLNNSEKYTSSTPYFIDSNSTILKNSLIFPKRGASIFQNKIRILKEDSYMDTNLMTITIIDESLNYEYLYYQLRKIGLDNLADTTSVPQINNKHINPFEIPLPETVQEQKNIAQILSDIDNEIEQLEQKLTKYQMAKQGMMQQLLTGKIKLIKPIPKAKKEDLAMAAEPNEIYERK